MKHQHNNPHRPSRRPLLGLVAALMFLAPVAGVHARPLLSNPEFDSATSDPSWPDDWPRPRGGAWSSSWKNEDGRKFISLTATEPGQTILVYRLVPIPSDVKAVELTLRARVTGLKPGPKAWFDARVMTDFKNANGAKIKGARAISFRKSTDGWVDKSVRFAVPEDATAIELMPTLFEVDAGTFDVDMLQLTAIDPATL